MDYISNVWKFGNFQVDVPNSVGEIPQAIEGVKKKRKEIEEGKLPKQSTSSPSAAAITDEQIAGNENKSTEQEQDGSDLLQNSPAEDNEDNSAENDESSPPSNSHSGEPYGCNDPEC